MKSQSPEQESSFTNCLFCITSYFPLNLKVYFFPEVRKWSKLLKWTRTADECWINSFLKNCITKSARNYVSLIWGRCIIIIFIKCSFRDLPDGIFQFFEPQIFLGKVQLQLDPRSFWHPSTYLNNFPKVYSFTVLGRN